MANAEYGKLIDKIYKSIDLFAKNGVQPRYCYMNFNKFLKLFPKLWEYIVFRNGSWYFKYSDIEIIINNMLEDDVIMFSVERYEDYGRSKIM